MTPAGQSWPAYAEQVRSHSDNSAVFAATVAGDVVDCLHRGHAALVTPTGELLWSLGSPEVAVFERSTTKPFRAMMAIEAGVTSSFDWTDEDLALVAGSHSGTRVHVARAARLLASVGLTEAALTGPPRVPLGEDGVRELAEDGGGVSKLHGDCSGEHVGVLALCQLRRHSTDGYWKLNHPVQESFFRWIDAFAPGIDRAVTVSDRCLLPTSAVQLAGLAHRFARFVDASGHSPEAAQLLGAIQRYPRMFTGQGRLVGDLIEGSGGEIVGKCGAEGLYTIGWVSSGLALAVKVVDGNHRAALPVITHVAMKFGLTVPRVTEPADPSAFADVIGLLE